MNFNNIKPTMGRLFMAFLVLAAGCFQGCEDRLEEKPYSFYSGANFFENVNQADMAVLGVYETLSNQDTYGFLLSMSFAIDTDIAQISGTSLSDDKRQIAHYAVYPTLSWLEKSWTLLYKGIERANVCIDRIPKMEQYQNGTDEEKALLQRYYGEALFLRGLLYFDLVRTWGDVPFKTNPTKATDDLNTPQTDREIIYDQIFKDMEAAAELIPWASEGAINERATKGAVKGILARACMYRAGYSLRREGENGVRRRPDNFKEYYEKAAKLTKEVMDEGIHGLNDSYEQVFLNYCQHKADYKESMFEVAFYNATGDRGNSGYVGTWNGPKIDGKSSYGRANSYYKALPNFYDSYAANDSRRDVAVATFYIDKNDVVKEYTVKKKKDHLWAPGKWRRNWQEGAPKNPNNTDVNWVLLRYSDVLLMRAEAENEVEEGPNQAAYDAINEVRDRAGLDDLPEGLDHDAFLAAVQQERAWELCFEGWRKGDLIRWNILGESLRKTQEVLKDRRSNFPYIAGDNFTDDKNELMPIPQREVDGNKNCFQNPGFN